jgi:hypothetical protein
MANFCDKQQNFGIFEFSVLFLQEMGTKIELFWPFEQAPFVIYHINYIYIIVMYNCHQLKFKVEFKLKVENRIELSALV